MKRLGMAGTVDGFVQRVREFVKNNFAITGRLFFTNSLTLENVKVAIAEIRKGSQILIGMEWMDEIKIVGVIYDVHTGEANFF